MATRSFGIANCGNAPYGYVRSCVCDVLISNREAFSLMNTRISDVAWEGLRLKVCLVGSSGGHLYQLYKLEPFWSTKDRFWVTFSKNDATSLLKDERSFWCHYPTNRNVWNLMRNTALAVRVLLRERPDLIISTGAAVAVPFFYIGKCLGAKTVFIEVFDRIDQPSLTGRMVYPVSDRFIVQWDDMKKKYPKAVCLGGMF